MDDLDLIIRRRDLIALGDSLSSIERSLRRGELLSVAPGAYVPGDIWASLSPAHRYRLRVLASIQRLPSEPVISHFSAAALWGLDIWRGWPSAVDVLVASGSGKSSGSIRRHGSDLALHDTTRIGDLVVTTPAQTAVDIAALLPFGEAVVTIDSVLRIRSAGTPAAIRSELREACSRIRGRAGSARAAAAVEFGRSQAESPLESMSRVRIAEAGLPEPELQHQFLLHDGRTARVDFWWPDHKIIGEADGRGKYVRDPHDTESIRASVIEEKNRENELRRITSGFARWEYRDVVKHGRLASILRTAGLR